MLSKDDILAIISNELSMSSNSQDDGGTTSLEDSLSYYLGKPNGTEVEGRSQVISTDVADAIEWIMPQVMKSFTQNNEIVIFDPVHEGDERQAEMESEYVYEVLMKQNDGFIILHQFVKDALMQQNGIIKTYYANTTEIKTYNHTGITEQQLQQLLSTKSIELVEQSEYIDEQQTAKKFEQINMQLQQMQQQSQNPQAQQDPQQVQAMQQQAMQLQQELQKPIMLYDVKISVERRKGQIYVDSVPPEEFRFNRSHDSINLDNARFTAHVMDRSVSEVIEEFGVTKEQTDELPEGSSNYYDSEYRFALQDESVFWGATESDDDSQRELEIAECYIKIDIEEDGIAKLMKITVAGDENPTEILSAEEISCSPWVSTTAFLMSHKFKGLSITDRLKQIQDQKTALWRNMLDNMYLQNNQRNVVVEGQVNMDDLLVSRPGGIIRAKRIDAIMPLPTPQLGQDSYNMMEYLDKVRAGRTGVDPDGGATPQSIGDRVGSQGVDRMMNAKEELVGLIIRVIAETGVKPLCVKIRDLSVKHIDAVVDFRFRGVWQQINPSEWLDRTRTTVRVGTGTGNHAQQLMAIEKVFEYQDRMSDAPGQYIVDWQQMYTAMDDFCKFSGLNGASRYFIDPTSPQGQKKKQETEQQQNENTQKQDQLNQSMAQAQQKLADAEMAKSQAQMASTQAKAQTDQAKNQLVAQKQGFESQIQQLEQQLDEAKAIADNLGKSADLQLRKYDIDQRTALELVRIESTAQTEENDNFEQNQETVSGQ